MKAAVIPQGPLLVRLMNGCRRPKVSILGVDLAGTVASVGRSVTRFAAGDHVFGSRGDKFGAHAEFVCVAEDIQPGERVLVHGAAGSLGTFGVQLAKHYGAHVTAVCGTTNVDLVRSLGADAIVDYTKQDFTRADAPYDVICDVLGKAGFPGSLHSLAPRGRYLLVGFSGGILAILAALFRGAWTHLRERAVFVAGPARPVQADLEFLKALIEDRRLRAVIGRSYLLNDIVEAHRYADSGHKVGNVVVVIP